MGLETIMNFILCSFRWHFEFSKFPKMKRYRGYALSKPMGFEIIGLFTPFDLPP